MKKQLFVCVSLVLAGASLQAQTLPFTRVPYSSVFQAEYPTPQANANYVADANLDGYNDVITTGQYAGQLIAYFWNHSAQKYSQHNVGGFNYNNAVWGNVAGGPQLDVIVTQSRDITVFPDAFQVAQYSFSTPVTLVAAAGIRNIDFDNDGDDDLIVGEYENGGDVFVFRNDNGTFTKADSLPNVIGAHNARISEIRVADLDNDGFVDAVAPNYNGGSSETVFQVLKNQNGTGDFTPEFAGTIGNANFGRSYLHLADLNNDGLEDIIMGIHDGVSKMKIWLNAGGFSFTPIEQTFPTKSAAAFSFADYNEDGNLDYAYFEGTFQDTAGVVLGNGDGTFQTGFAYLNLQDGGYYQPNQLSYDVNGDGRIDMVNKNAIHFNDYVAPQGWQIGIHAAQGALYANATLGMSNQATDGLDPALDTPEPPPSLDDQVRAYFYRPEFSGQITNNYSADIRGLSDPSNAPFVWWLYVESSVAGDVNLTFSPQMLDLPFVVRWSDGRFVYDGSDEDPLNIEVPVDGESATILGIWVGDITGPEIDPDEALYGPAIWDAAVSRGINFGASDPAGLSEVMLLASRNNGDSWETLFDSGDMWGKIVAKRKGERTAEQQDDYIFTAPEDWGAIENVLFRIVASDPVGNTSEWNGDEKITVARGTQVLPVNNGWNMMGASLTSISQSNTLLADAFRFSWSGTGYDPDASYAQFLGHWAGAYTAGADTVRGVVVTGEAGDGADVHLDSGWTQIANPLLRSTWYDNILVLNQAYEGQEFPFYAAVDSGWVAPYAIEFTGDGYYYAFEFLPNKAYWVGTYADVTLRFVIGADSFGPTKEVAPQPRLVLSLADGKLRNTLALVAGSGRDIPAPPAAPGQAESGFLGEKTVLGNLYTEKRVAETSRIETRIRVAGAPREVTLTWTGASLDGLRATLVLPNGRQYDLSVDGSATWNTSAGSPVVVTEPNTTAAEDGRAVPNEIALSQNYPNPFNPATTIAFSVPNAGQVRLSVMNLLGQTVATPVNKTVAAGAHQVSFDASRLASGVYVYRLEAGGKTLTRRMTLVK